MLYKVPEAESYHVACKPSEGIVGTGRHTKSPVVLSGMCAIVEVLLFCNNQSRLSNLRTESKIVLEQLHQVEWHIQQ